MSEGELSLTDYRALAEFRYRVRRFLHVSEQLARAAGLEPQQHQALLALKGLPADQTPTIGSLAERLQIQHHSAVELVDRLAERGLVERSRGEEDRRRVIVQLSEQGEEQLHALSLGHVAELRSTGPALARALTALIVATNGAGETSGAPYEPLVPDIPDGP